MSKTFRHRASFALNLVLVTTAVALVVRKPGAAPHDAKVVTPPTTNAPAAVPTRARDPSHAYSTTAAAPDQRRWLIDQLRAMGLPNQELASVVLADLDARWTKYSAAVAIKTHGDPATMAALQLQVDRTRDAEMRAALGEQGFREWDEANMLREIDRGNLKLTATETQAGYGLWKGLQQRQLDLREAQLKGQLDPAEASAAWAKAVSDYTAQMKNALGGDRYAQMQHPNNDAAEATLRRDMAGANPSAAQFQGLLQAQQQWNQQRAALDRQLQADPSSPSYAAQSQALDDARDAAYRRVLGDQAFDTLQKEQNASYASMKKHQQVWGLDDHTIDSVYGGLASYQKSVADYQAQARALEAQGQNVDWNAVNANLRQFANATQDSLRTLLGTERYVELEQNGVFAPLAPAPQYARPNGNLDPDNTVSIR